MHEGERYPMASRASDICHNARGGRDGRLSYHAGQTRASLAPCGSCESDVQHRGMQQWYLLTRCCRWLVLQPELVSSKVGSAFAGLTMQHPMCASSELASDRSAIPPGSKHSTVLNGDDCCFKTYRADRRTVPEVFQCSL